MIKVSNFADSEVQIVNQPVIQPQPIIQAKPIIQYVDREVIKEVMVPSPPETITVEKEPDLSQYAAYFQQYEDVLKTHHTELQINFKKFQMVAEELEMQRQALVALRAQRHIDRKNKVRLIKRLKKERNKVNFKFKLVFGFSLLLLASLFLKH